MATGRATSDHFDGKQFHNLDGVRAGGSLWDLLRWKLFGGTIPPWPEHTEADMVAPALPSRVERGQVAATFIGHSTFLLQFTDGLNVLTDPVWSERVSPVTFAGPKRVRRPAISLEKLPPVQVVLVSHAHYDHMDVTTLRRLDEQFAPQFVTGLGNRVFLQRQGLRKVEELDWWQTFVVRGDSDAGKLNVTFTPAQHWANRSVVGKNTTLWGGFWLQPAVGGPSVYFAGDSGLGRNFSLVRERLGKADLAFLPIGAYEPRWFMREQHMNPEDAVQAHLILETKRSVGMHFGTFRLTDEAIGEPERKLKEAMLTHGLAPETFTVPKFGETLWSNSQVARDAQPDASAQ